MFNLKKILLTILMASVFCTLFIHAVDLLVLNDVKAYEKCKESIREKFYNINLDLPVTEFVKYAILHMSDKKFIREMDGDDVADFYETLFPKLSTKNVPTPRVFCETQVPVLNINPVDPKRRLNLDLNLNSNPVVLSQSEKVTICEEELMEFYRNSENNFSVTKTYILINALYNHQRAVYEPRHNVHGINSYGYHYLEEVAKAVYIKSGEKLDGPDDFCFRKYSTPIWSQQEGPSERTEYGKQNLRNEYRML